MGEILGLTWNDIDFENNTICINHTLGYNSFDGKMRFFINKPKTKAGNREIPMLKDVRKILLKMREERHKTRVKTAVIDGYTDFVFVTRTGNPISYVNLNHLINKVLEYYNEEEKKRAIDEGREPNYIRRFSVHNIRHTFATRLCENETNLKAIQEIMGHTSVAITMDIYAEATKEAKEKSMKSLEGKIKLV